MSRLITMGFTVVFLASLTTLTADKPGPVDETKAVVHGNTQFALELYAKLGEKPGNLFFSPYSVSTALAMAYAGARAETATQMAQTLHFTLPPEQLHPAFSVLIRDVQAPGKDRPFQLSVANALWGQKGFPFLPAFLELTKTYYGAGLREVDFANATEQVRLAINRWIEEQTKDKIKDLLKPGVLTSETKLVLTNAIYFNAPWANQFNKELTTPAEFFVTPVKPVQVPMMHQQKFAPYHDGGTFELLELTYKGNDQSMLIFLPKKGQEFGAFERRIKPKEMDEWLSKLKGRQVNMAIPTFRVTSEFELSKTFDSLGLTRPFSSDADFSGIDGCHDLFISKIVHKAHVDVNETGTEAAAATAVLIIKAAPPGGEPVEFRANRPFTFAIRDRKTGSVLFMGRVSDPRS